MSDHPTFPRQRPESAARLPYWRKAPEVQPTPGKPAHLRRSPFPPPGSPVTQWSVIGWRRGRDWVSEYPGAINPSLLNSKWYYLNLIIFGLSFTKSVSYQDLDPTCLRAGVILFRYGSHSSRYGIHSPAWAFYWDCIFIHPFPEDGPSALQIPTARLSAAAYFSRRGYSDG